MIAPKIGRGKNMSIAKAALKVYYEWFKDECNGVAWFIYSGDTNLLHKIVDEAGAKHCSLFTGHQVLSCLRSSPFWEVSGTIPGWGNRMANVYVPSEKGISYYEDHIKDNEPKAQ